MRKVTLLSVALALVLAARPVRADETIFQGLDVWYTPSGGAQITIDIPAGMFCGGTSSPLPGKVIPLKGRPVVTVPAGVLSPADTVIDRAAASFSGGLTTTTTLLIRALSLVSTSPFLVSCPSGPDEAWNTEVSLNGAQIPGTIVIRRPSVGAPGGDFDASFPVSANVGFVNNANGMRTGSLTDNVTITSTKSCWTHAPGAQSFVDPNPVTLDTDGDQIADYASPYGTSNFFSCVPIHHDGPHPTTCGKPGSYCPELPCGTLHGCNGGCCAPGQTKCNAQNQCCTPQAQFQVAAVRSGPPAQMDITVQDSVNGLGTITVRKLVNGTINVPTFTAGTKDPVTVTVTKTDPSQPAQVELAACSPDGCCQNGDPVLTVLRVGRGMDRTRETFREVPAREHFLSVQNGKLGLEHLHVFVNGKRVGILDLASREVRTLDLADQMKPGRNVVTVTGIGPAGSRGLVLLSDVRGSGGAKAAGRPYVLSWDSDSLRDGVNLHWGQ